MVYFSLLMAEINVFLIGDPAAPSMNMVSFSAVVLGMMQLTWCLVGFGKYHSLLMWFILTYCTISPLHFTLTWSRSKGTWHPLSQYCPIEVSAPSDNSESTVAVLDSCGS